jgi:DNA-binding CsgD family transcriptional regulator
MDAHPLSLDELSELIGLVYEGPLEPVPWRTSLQALRERLRANHVTLILRSSTRHDPGMYVNAGDVTTEGYVSYATQYFSLDPFVGLPVEKVMTVLELLGEARWLQSPLYRDFLSQYGIFHVMGVDIRTPEGEECRLRVCRPQDGEAFDEQDKALCGRLVPHLKRAMVLHARLDRSESERKLYANTVERLMVCAILLDEHGRIMRTNEAADDLLRAGDGLRTRGGLLEAAYAIEQRELQRIVKGALLARMSQQASVVEAMAVSRPSGKSNLGVVIRGVPPGEWSEGRHRPAVAVFVRDPESKPQAPLDVVQQMFGLTRAEAAMALQLADGLSLDEASQALGIQRNTARAHLRAIFSKAGVTRQSELVRVLLNSVAALAYRQKP